MVVDDDRKRGSEIVTQLKGLNAFESVVTDQNFSKAVEDARRLSSMDMIVMSYDISQPNVKQALELMSKDYRLAFCPKLIVCKSKQRVDARELDRLNTNNTRSMSTRVYLRNLGF